MAERAPLNAVGRCVSGRNGATVCTNIFELTFAQHEGETLVKWREPVWCQTFRAVFRPLGRHPPLAPTQWQARPFADRRSLGRGACAHLTSLFLDLDPCHPRH
jgi:hypothetical protein